MQVNRKKFFLIFLKILHQIIVTVLCLLLNREQKNEVLKRLRFFGKRRRFQEGKVR